MSNDLKEEFWSRIDKVQAGMLHIEGGRAMPMSPYAEKDETAIWFITARGADAGKAAEAGNTVTFHIADSKANLYANVTGRLRAVNDEQKLDELWNAVAAAWFEDGRDDPDVELICLTPQKAEVWATTSAAAFMYEIAKANLTDGTPDMGEHGTITF